MPELRNTQYFAALYKIACTMLQTVGRPHAPGLAARHAPAWIWPTAATRGYTLVIMSVVDTLQSTHKDPVVIADKAMLEGVDPKEDGISAASWDAWSRTC
ncbi:hypothetical protein WJX84_009698 [Apatococcus fuscideae]|uniref:Uncharacterized protein n=1 Tax=Apatococcus fuscideae TaxID=2026836 RepID=A0AAW1T8H7_9CHLO